MILNRPSNGLLSVLLVLRKAVLAFGPLPRAELVELCAPAAATGSPPEDSAARRTLGTWIQLGMFVERDGMVALTKPFDEPNLRLEQMRNEALTLILSPVNNKQLAASSAADEDGSGATDFTRAICWALMQDPHTLAVDSTLADLAREQRLEPVIFSNDTRRLGFEDWGHFLGFLLPIGKSTVVNPTRALRPHVQELLARKDRVPIDAFLANLAERVPVVDHGAFWRTVVEQSHLWPRKFATNEISPALSLALRQLEHEGVLVLQNRSDAGERRNLLGRRFRELQGVTHVAGGAP